MGRNKKRERHGQTKTKLYNTWIGMIDRCYNVNNKSYKYYGPKGVIVCDRWLESFLNFKSDMGEKPSPFHSLDRINPFGNYEPQNCRWATPEVQGSNKRSNYKPIESGVLSINTYPKNQ